MSIRTTLNITIITALSFACGQTNNTPPVSNQKKVDIQGHRGARGLMPENSIPGFVHAMELGVSTLELDLCVTKDRKIVVSHEPYFSSDFCLKPDGQSIPPDSAIQHNIYRMTYDEVRAFDCGSKKHASFPEQVKMKVSKPLLSEVFAAVEPAKVSYNIEIKSMDQYDDEFHPKPGTFSDLVYQEIDGVIPWERITIQSFDFRVLRTSMRPILMYNWRSLLRTI